MRRLKQEIYFPTIIFIHFLFWAIDLYFYKGNFSDVGSDTMFFGYLNTNWENPSRILGEVFSSWVVTVFAFNFLMATRAKWVEDLFGGLDKMYLIHRRSGVIAVALLIAHFLIVPRSSVFNVGKPLGFYAFIFIIIGVIISAAPYFKKKIPYNKWVNVHKLMGLFYTMAVVHGVMVESLIKELPITRIYVFGMAFVGIAAWVYRAFLFPLFNKKIPYIVTEVKELSNGVSEIILQTDKNALEFFAGQFAFFTFPSISKREQHPFTISSHPKESGLRLTIKGLGDYTNDLFKKIKKGDQALVEGPYGHFTSNKMVKKHQIWIAGGIGITPFLSLSKGMLPDPVTLYWCVNDVDDAYHLDELKQQMIDNPNFEFILWPAKQKGYLSLEQLKLKDPKAYGYLICGPKTLKSKLTEDLVHAGVSPSVIYDEEFAFR